MTESTIRPSMPPRQRGIALLLVLWVLVLLTIIAGSFVFDVRGNTRQAANVVAAARAQAAADGGIERGAFELIRPQGDADRWQPDGSSHVLRVGDADVVVTLTDEAGHIDLNTAPPTVLSGLLRSVGLDPGRADALAQDLVDWRNAVALPGQTTEGPKRGRFHNIESLQAVPGITPELFRRLAPLVTVYSRQPGVDTAIAPLGVLQALPGVDPSAAQAFVAQREQLRAGHQPVGLLAQASAFHTGALSGCIGIHAEAALPDGTRASRSVVVRVAPGGTNPLRYLDWRAD